MKVTAVKMLNGRLLEKFKRTVEWHGGKWQSELVIPGADTEVILIGVDGEETRVPYEIKELPPPSYYEKKSRDRLEWQRTGKLVIVFLGVGLLTRLFYSEIDAFTLALVLSIALHQAYKNQDLRERLERIEKVVNRSSIDSL